MYIRVWRMKGSLLILAHIFAFTQVVPALEQEEYREATPQHIKEDLQEYISSESIDFFSDLLKDRVYSNVAFKILVPKRGKECVYQYAGKHTGLKFEFECLSPPSFTSDGKVSADIDLLLNEATIGKTKLKHFTDKRRGWHEFRVIQPGTYRFCIDNTNSGDKKFIQLSVEVWKFSEVPKFHLENHMNSNNSMYNIYDELFQITKGVSLMKSALLHTKALSKYDASMLLSNLNMVNRFSVIFLIVIIAACLLQIHLVKNMFDSTRVSV